jgi:ferredoxin
MTACFSYSVDAKACIRCAACATIAPRHFQVKQGPAKVLRSAETERERAGCDAAMRICPTQAIHASAEAIAADAPQKPEPKELYPTVMNVAEQVRWKVSDLPWDRFDPAKATPELKAVVREMAYSEQTTFSATQKFMAAFGKDADFSQWISVWFYEETRHPLVLLEWLKLAGEVHDDDFVQKGRESEPFMPSLVGTLVINIISEMVAAHAYLHMASGRLEPLLYATVTKLAADEGRHGASFFTFARRLIETSANPERDRLDALKVLHFWLNIGNDVSHPVNQAMKRLEVLLPPLGAPPFVPPNDRIAQVIGALTGLQLNSAAELQSTMLEHTRKVRALQAAPRAAV